MSAEDKISITVAVSQATLNWLSDNARLHKMSVPEYAGMVLDDTAKGDPRFEDYREFHDRVFLSALNALLARSDIEADDAKRIERAYEIAARAVTQHP